MKRTLILLSLLGSSLVSFGQTNDLFSSVGSFLSSTATNWVAIPYGVYDTGTHKWGYGGAVLYKVSPNFWTGVRAEKINGLETTCGVQAQLQATIKLFGTFDLTPFAETSVGIGQSSLYGNAGAGAFVNLYNHSFGKVTLTIGGVADYEHYVITAGSSGNKLDAGPLLNLNF